ATRGEIWRPTPRSKVRDLSAECPGEGGKRMRQNKTKPPPMIQPRRSSVALVLPRQIEANCPFSSFELRIFNRISSFEFRICRTNPRAILALAPSPLLRRSVASSLPSPLHNAPECSTFTKHSLTRRVPLSIFHPRSSILHFVPSCLRAFPYN